MDSTTGPGPNRSCTDSFANRVGKYQPPHTEIGRSDCSQANAPRGTSASDIAGQWAWSQYRALYKAYERNIDRASISPNHSAMVFHSIALAVDTPST
jgi:hypothetical protein